MGKISWKTITELVGIVTIVGSLLFVGLQMKQSQDIALSELRVSLLAIGVESDIAKTDHAEIWKKGLAGDELGETEQVIFEILLRDHISIVWTEQWQYGQFEQYGAQKISIAIFAQFLFDNPGSRKSWIEGYGKFQEDTEKLLPSFRDPFQSAVLGHLKTLDQPQN